MTPAAMSLPLYRQRLDDRNFARLREAVYSYCGIRLGERKRQMVEGRLRKRVRALGLSGLADYCRLVFDSPEGSDEFINLIDVITTNKTDFFREPEHFRYLTGHCLPLLQQGRTEIQLWSAACSTGEEPWTLAMVLEEERRRAGDFDYRVVASDICTRVLREAARAVYDADRVAGMAPALKKRYLARGKGPSDGLVRIVPELRKKVRFVRANLKSGPLPVRRADVVFCRNVLIYFDAPTQEHILRRLASCIRPGGFLFLGHSESVHGMRLPLRQVRPTVYRLGGT